MLNFRSYSSTILSAFQFVHLSVIGTLFGQVFSRPSEEPLTDSMAERPFTAHFALSLAYPVQEFSSRKVDRICIKSRGTARTFMPIDPIICDWNHIICDRTAIIGAKPHYVRMRFSAWFQCDS